jgi:hypothetical protein
VGILKAKAMETAPRKPPHQMTVKFLMPILFLLKILPRNAKPNTATKRDKTIAIIARRIRSRFSNKSVILICEPIKRM